MCGASRADSPAGARLRCGADGSLLWAHGRFDPGVRYPLPLAGPADQPGDGQPRSCGWRVVYRTCCGSGGNHPGWAFQPVAESRFRAPGVRGRVAGVGHGRRDAHGRGRAGAGVDHGGRQPGIVDAQWPETGAGAGRAGVHGQCRPVHQRNHALRRPDPAVDLGAGKRSLRHHVQPVRGA
ncbi:hypothetical protein D3C73_1254670 [compost metagenome]